MAHITGKPLKEGEVCGCLLVGYDFGGDDPTGGVVTVAQRKYTEQGRDIMEIINAFQNPTAQEIMDILTGKEEENE